MSQWYYVDGNRQRQGPVEDVTLAARWQSGSVGLDSLVWREGQDSWRPLEEFRTELDLGGAGRAVPPPLPEGFVVAQPQHAPGPPPRSGMSGCLIALIVTAVLLVPGTAILAAIALPAYQDYTLRAKIAAAASAAAPLKNTVSAYLEQHGRCPTDSDLATADLQRLAQGHVTRATVGEFETKLCGIELQIGGAGNEDVDGKAVWFEFQPDGGTWQCSSEIQDRYLPRDCRG